MISVTKQEIKEEILSYFISKVNELQNCASIVISKEMLPFTPRSGYNIMDYVDERLLNEVENRDFDYYYKLSDENQLVFIKK